MRTKRDKRVKARVRELEKAVSRMSKDVVRAGVAKDARLDLRLTQREKDVLAKAAKAAGATITDFVLRAALLVAEKLGKK